MKRLLIAILTTISLPVTVNAEVSNVYLLGRTKNNSYVVPMKTLEACEAAGQKFINKKSWNQVGKPDPSALLTYVCVRAK
tara:strand:- start:156 stop:395 length:240 start_codon:yes stop_codon:yes gene_type:complete